MPPGLEADQGQIQVCDCVANRNVRALIGHLDQHRPSVDPRRQAAAAEALGELGRALLHLDRERPGALREGVKRRCAQESSCVDGE